MSTHALPGTRARGFVVGFHLLHGEPQVLPVNIVIGGLAAFVAWGRLRKAPISPR